MKLHKQGNNFAIVLELSCVEGENDRELSQNFPRTPITGFVFAR